MSPAYIFEKIRRDLKLLNPLQKDKVMIQYVWRLKIRESEIRNIRQVLTKCRLINNLVFLFWPDVQGLNTLKNPL